MNRSKATLLWGAGLLVLGLVLLLQNLQVLPNLVGVIWFAIFALGGIAFLGVYASDRQRWWAVIPGGALLGIALLIGLDVFLPEVGGALGGTLFLFVLGATFLAIFFLHRENWWAIIPGGVLFTVALVALLDQVTTDLETGSIMMLGLAATFAVLSRVETPQGRLRWPLIPAVVLLAIGLIILFGSLAWAGWLFALGLIVVGGYLIYRSVAARQ